MVLLGFEPVTSVQESYQRTKYSNQFTAIGCLASSVSRVVGRSDACSLMCAGGPGSIPEVDTLVSGFQPSGVGEMSSNQYVVESECESCGRKNSHVWFMQPEAQPTTRVFPCG